MNRAQRRATKHAHAYDPHSIAVSASRVMEAKRKELLQAVEAERQSYQQQLYDKADDNWRRCLAQAGLVYREITGSTSKTEKYLSRLAEYMEQTMDRTTEDLMAELARVTDIELEVR